MTRIADLLAEGPTLSVEFFPPKTDDGMATLMRTVEELGPLGAFTAAVRETGYLISNTFTFLKRLVAGREDKCNLGGPVKIAEMAGQAAQQGFQWLIQLTALLSVGVGILNRLNLIFEGSLGYFGVGLIDGPNVRIKGRVGWSCGENMMAGTILIENNAGSQFGAALRGGDLVCKGDVGSRTGIDMKGGNIIVGGSTGSFTGFMMQRGRMVICGDAGKNLGDSMYDGTIFLGGEPRSLGVDAIWSEMTDLDKDWLEKKLTKYDVMPKGGIGSFRKIVAGKQLWNYDNLEPTEKKLVL